MATPDSDQTGMSLRLDSLSETPIHLERSSPKILKVVYFGSDFPNDDVLQLLRKLHLYSKDRRYPIVSRFIDEVTLAVRDEVRQLPSHLRSLVPPFQSVLHLGDETELRQGPLGESVSGSLLCVLQLAAFIG